jgi:hypothetical protein
VAEHGHHLISWSRRSAPGLPPILYGAVTANQRRPPGSLVISNRMQTSKLCGPTLSLNPRPPRTHKLTSMSLIKKLPSDIWFLITEYLDLHGLIMISRSFAGIYLDVDIDLISASQATKILYRLIAQGTPQAEVSIRSDRKLWERPHIHEYKFKHRGRPCKPVITNMTSDEFTPQQTFMMTSTNVKMNLSSNSLHDVFYPAGHGGDPIEPASIRIQYFPVTCGNINDGDLLLNYSPNPETSANTLTLKDTQTTSNTSDRVIGQELQLSRAYLRWLEYGPPVLPNSRQPRQRQLKEQDLPLNWFKFLMNQIHVEVLFEKWSRHQNPPPEEWVVASSELKAISITFEPFPLPTSKSLRKLFPPNKIDFQDAKTNED